jgi:hypothetical protein
VAVVFDRCASDHCADAMGTVHGGGVDVCSDADLVFAYSDKEADTAVAAGIDYPAAYDFFAVHFTEVQGGSRYGSK